MILRRLRLQAPEHNWFATIVDLFILVAGVFLGIQVSNWNQSRLDRATGHVYRQRLIEDLDDNVGDLADRGRYYSTVRAHAVAALADLNGISPRNDGTFLIHAFEATQINLRKLKRFTYDEMLARGASPWSATRSCVSRLPITM